MQGKDENKNSFTLGFLTGSISGAVIALLYAPKSGKKLRRSAMRKKKEIAADADVYLEKVRKEASSIITDGKRKTERQISYSKKQQ